VVHEEARHGPLLPSVRTLGPGWFALVMATGIVSTAAARQGFPRISLALLAVATVSYAVLVILSLVRLWRWPADVHADLVAPQRAFGSFAVVAGSAVLGERLDEQHVGAVALGLLVVAAVAWLVLGYAVPALVVLAPDKPGLTAVDGSWLLWVVATQAVSVGAALAAHRGGALHELATVAAVTTWAVGVALDLVLLTVLLLRLLVVRVRPPQMTTPYWIIMGATAISVLAGSRILRLDGADPLVRLTAPVVSGLSFLLWAFGTWTIPLLVVFGIWRHVLRRERPVYTPQLWTLVFPLGMYSVATGEFGDVTGLGYLAVPARAAFGAALLAWVVVFGMMLTAFARAPRLAALAPQRSDGPPASGGSAS
jgi:tellurite resistance protein TehA-like permease